MGLMSIFDVNMVDKIWEFVPFDDISIRVLHLNHPMQLEEDEYRFTVPIGTTLGDVKQKVLDAKFRRVGWVHDELFSWERMRPLVV
jgi:hypothetical protein